MKWQDSVLVDFFIWIFLSFILISSGNYVKLLPKVTIGVLIRNKAFALPYFFHYIENFNYPKTRIGIIIYEDHSIDGSNIMVEKWCDKLRTHYAFMDCTTNVETDKGYNDELSSNHWSHNRMQNVIRLREKIITISKLRWSDYLFMVDADVILTNENIITILIERLLKYNGGAVAPLLNCTSLQFYSNFWDNMTESGFYVRTDRYFPIKNANLLGTFQTSVIHSAILFNLNHIHSDSFSYRRGMNSVNVDDDIINFAVNAKLHNISLLINNEHLYGYFPGPVDSKNDGYYIEQNTFMNLLFHFILYNNYNDPYSLKYERYLKLLDQNEYNYPKINVNEIFVINLKRRNNRRKIINLIFKAMKIDFRFFTAIDGKSIDRDFLSINNINQLKGYIDPYYKRNLKYGEIGCFVSHFKIWKKMVERNLSKIMVLEDDFKCTSEFPFLVNDLISEADNVYPEWEFFYLGRKIMTTNQELFINGSRNILIPNYSYRTTGYILKLNGAMKLINENPLQKMVALDEYIPIMFGKNPHKEWLQSFIGRGSLKAVACSPVIITPSHFKGEFNHISDTESSDLINS